jgi:hypothetical protein
LQRTVAAWRARMAARRAPGEAAGVVGIHPEPGPGTCATSMKRICGMSARRGRLPQGMLAMLALNRKGGGETVQREVTAIGQAAEAGLTALLCARRDERRRPQGA